jgi:hypothetical protein
MRIEYMEGGRRSKPRGRRGCLGVDGHVTSVAERYASRQEHGEPCQNVVCGTGPCRGSGALRKQRDRVGGRVRAGRAVRAANEPRRNRARCASSGAALGPSHARRTTTERGGCEGATAAPGSGCATAAPGGMPWPGRAYRGELPRGEGRAGARARRDGGEAIGAGWGGRAAGRSGRARASRAPRQARAGGPCRERGRAA